MISDQNKFLKRINNFLMHYSSEYADFLSSLHDSIEIKIIRNYCQDNQLQGIFPYAIFRDDHLGVCINSLPFYGSHGGPISLKKEVTKNLIEEFFNDISELDPSFTTVIENPFFPLDEETFKENGFIVEDDRIGQLTYLPKKMEDFHQKTRNAIRKGQKIELSIDNKIDNDSWAWMQEVHEKSINKLGGKPKSKKIFESLRKNFGDKVELWTGSSGEELIAGVVIIKYENTIEYFTPVVEEEFRDSQALSALIYDLMENFSMQGFKLWNWGGTWRSQEGVYRFKNRWGAEDMVYRYFNKKKEDISEESLEEFKEKFPFFYLCKY